MPRTGARRWRAVATGALAAGFLCACTGGNDPVGDGTTTATTAPTTTATTSVPTSTTLPLPTTLPGQAGAPELATVRDVVDSVLLDENALARTYPRDPFEAFRYEPVVAPNICGDDIDATYPPVVISGTQLSSEDLHLDVVEEIRVFRDAPHAQVAAEAVVLSLRECDGLPEDTQLSGPSFVTRRVGGERAVRYRMVTPDADTVFVLVTLANATVALTFTRPAVDDEHPTTTTTSSSTTTTTRPGQPPTPANRDLAVTQQAIELISGALAE